MSMLRKALVLTAATLVSGAVFAATAPAAAPATPATPAHHAHKHAVKKVKHQQHHVEKHAAKKTEGKKAAE